MFSVLHSSAGAGKTHALVKHYLAQCLNGDAPDAYRQVLALTFTNKAAGEMRERVLSYLEKLAEGSQAGAIPSLRTDLVTDLRISEEEVKKRAQRTLRHMLHHWSDVAIGTIDAFTRRVVQPFARDLRLDHELRMTTDHEHYRNAAVDLLLAEAGTDPALTDLLVATCQGLIEDEQGWRVDRPIRELSAQLDKEDALEHLAALRELGNELFIDLDRRLRQRIRAMDKQLHELGQTALDTLAAEGIVAKDMAYSNGGPMSYLRKLTEFEKALAPMGANTRKPLDNDHWSSSSADAVAKATLQRLAPMLRATIEQAEALRPQLRDHAIACAVQRDLMPSAVLHRLDRTLEDLKRSEGVVFFSDLTRKVAAVVQEEPAPFIHERLGERYTHFLIDEFQDTSLLQWQCLLPLVENALSVDGTVLLVGDAKQAIYRWRNGEVRQFIDLPSIFRKELLPQGALRERALRQAFQAAPPLVHNRRSARSVIAFNNALFAAMRDILPERFRQAYHDLAQEPHKALEGLVSLRALEERTDDGPAPFVALTTTCVREALADGHAAGDIAVLVRSRKDGAAVSAQLVAEGFRVVSPDGLQLGGDVACDLVLAVLGFLRHGNEAHAAHAMQQLAVLKATTAIAYPFRSEGTEPGRPRELLRGWLSEHPEISPKLPLVELIGRISRAIGLGASTDAYLLFMLDEAHTFTLDHGPDLSGFLDHWERTGQKRAIELPPDASAIRVMTIHSAKGLQFPVVIIPNAEMRGKGRQKEFLWLRPGPVVPELPSALIRTDKSLKDQAVPEVEEDADLKLLDEVNLLYVAFTRPVERLYAGVDVKANTALSAALRSFLGDPAGGPWLFGKREPASAQPASDPPEMLSPLVSGGWQGHLELRHEAPEEWDPADPDPGRSFGNAVHDVLGRVQAPGDLGKVLDHAISTGALPGPRADALRDRLQALLASPGMDAFYDEDITVRNEATLIGADGLAYRPDRIVLDAQHTRVLDIKTGRPARHHHEQVANYVRLLRDLGLPQVSGHLLYVNDGQLIPVDA
jgi:ATP-dependent exoDNAse (exonuclease V) beta subunit